MREFLARIARSQRIHHFVLVLIPALIVIASISGFVWAQKKVTVVVDGHAVEVTTQADDVAAVLAQAGIETGAGDVITPAVDMAVADGATVVVRRSVPVEVEVGGETVEVDVVGKTVADALVAVGADPGSHPEVSPSLDTALHPGMTVTVPDSFVRVKSEEVEIAAPADVVEDPALARGEQRTIIEGAPGRVLRVYRTLVAGGVEGPEELSAEETLVAPVKSLVAVGTGSRTLYPEVRLRGSKPKAARTMTVLATGYCSQEAGLGPRTCLGVPAVHGVIAVDPDVIPLRTKVYIPGYGFAIAADTGSMINDDHIDLCFDTIEEMNRWGKRTIEIIILD